jgi:hypothetical protein
MLKLRNLTRAVVFISIFLIGSAIGIAVWRPPQHSHNPDEEQKDGRVPAATMPTDEHTHK